MESDPRTSTLIDPACLRDHAASRRRDKSGKIFALIKSTIHPSFPLAIHNYTQDSLFRNAWDPLTIAARTLVTETTTGTVVSRSFSKFFNYHEKHAYKPSGDEATVVVEEKLDGSIASVFWYANEWRIISKAQFDGHHVQMAREILNEMYPGATEGLDKEKTYVFEIIHPSNTIGVRYDRKDMILLSIFSKDAREPPGDFDWSVLPFRRPRILEAGVVKLEELRRMNPLNEEGLVVKFYPTADDPRPQRVKVKFESYLELIKSKHDVAPLELYTKSRGGFPELDEELVRKRMAAVRDNFIHSLHQVADDFGGEPWLRQIEDVWSQIDEIFVQQEREWRRVTTMLQEDGYTNIGDRNPYVKRAFAKRIMQEDVDARLHTTLFMWYSNAALEAQIASFVRNVTIPKHLKKIQVLGDRRRKATTWKED